MQKVTRPCFECQHCINKPSIAGGYYCSKKKTITSIARITDKDGHNVIKDCFEWVQDEKKI